MFEMSGQYYVLIRTEQVYSSVTHRGKAVQRGNKEMERNHTYTGVLHGQKLKIALSKLDTTKTPKPCICIQLHS